jgi:hypothetical protein
MHTQSISRPYCETRPAALGGGPGWELRASKFRPPHRLPALRGLLMACVLATPFWLTLTAAVFLLSR